MGRFHEWKGRKQAQVGADGYPFDNVVAFATAARDPLYPANAGTLLTGTVSGSTITPGATGGATLTLTVTNTATAAERATVFAVYDDASNVRQTIAADIDIAASDTPTLVADKISAALDGVGDVGCTNVAGVCTLTLANGALTYEGGGAYFQGRAA